MTMKEKLKLIDAINSRNEARVREWDELERGVVTRREVLVELSIADLRDLVQAMERENRPEE